MQTMRSMSKSITFGIIIFLVIGFVLPSTTMAATVYPTDGVWEDTFDNKENVTTTNCDVKAGEIVLNQEVSLIPYNFTQKDHEAYVYQSFFFLPIAKFFAPKNHLSREVKLGSNDIYKLKKIDQEYAARSSSTIQKYIIQHFRFKIDIGVETVSNIKVTWNGKTNANARIDFYYYNSSRLTIGGWQRLSYEQANGSDSSFNYFITGGAIKYAVDGENYIDISVVAYFPFLFRTCTLSTDFIGVTTRTETGYTLDYASAETTNAIDPKNISTNYKTFYWDLLTWDDYQQAGAEARYQVLYFNGSGYPEVEDTVLPGNHNGFVTAPVYLNNLSNLNYGTKYNKLKIRANLSTTTPSTSPRIFSWAITWQNKTHWQDSFSTYYRIDQRKKVIKENGTISISLIQDEWPLFGFDAGNTRASSGKGAATNNLYWFGGEYVGGGFCNPVIGNGNVYILSNERSLHQYKVVLPKGLSEGDPQVNTSEIKFDYNVVNSPAVTDDFVIVATGQKDSGGHENHIYGYLTKNLTLKWDFSYGQKICYDASPVVAGNTIFICTWGGDNGTYLNEKNRYTNNKLLTINLDTGVKGWEYSLPASSFSTPAVTNDKVIVACSSTDNDSVIALNLNGEKIWGKAIGAVGHASPVIYEDTVFITCKAVVNKKAVTKIVALNLNDGTILWNATVSELASSFENVAADSTPAVYEGMLYVASPEGTVYALHTVNGTTRWTFKIYSIPLFSESVLLSSPAYAENHIYIGTPAGKIYSINATTGVSPWTYDTFPIWTAAPVRGSPVISNGLVFIADENGVLYSLGKFTTSTKEVAGRIISEPIRLPESLWWDSFYADYSSLVYPLSSITFKLLDKNGNILKDLQNKTSLTLGGLVLERTVRLQADFSSTNLSNLSLNPKLFRWYVTLTSDIQKPFLNSSSFTPATAGWLQEVVPVFTIKVKDNGTGLRVKSAVYALEYILNNVTQLSTSSALCTGDNGTNAWQTLTMNISMLPHFNNITSLRSLTFNITDLAGNTASKTVSFKQDTKKPTSHVKAQGMKKRYNSSFVLINATSNDTGTLNVDASGIKRVDLYYRYSQINNFSGDWILIANSTRSLPVWHFNFTNHPNQHGGFFELCTVATDNASNVEAFPATGDISFLYDWKAPDFPSFSGGDSLWFKERPQFSVVFEDDYRLDTIQYRPNFETLWTTIATNVNESIYDTDTYGNSWSLQEDYWDQMAEGDIYYLYFKINDTLGNTLSVTSDSQAIVIRKDISAPSVSIDLPAVVTELTWADNFTVEGLGNDQNGSGIMDALLYYRYSEDKLNWSSWTTYGDPLDSSPFKWDFNATEGDGYYEMKINVTDYAGNARESEVFSVNVASFPMTLALIMVGLVVVLVFISAILYIKWRKRK